MKLIIFTIFTVLVLFALHSEIDGVSAAGNDSENCQGKSDRRCPQILCGPDGPKGWRKQDNSKPYPECCGGPKCA